MTNFKLYTMLCYLFCATQAAAQLSGVDTMFNHTGISDYPSRDLLGHSCNPKDFSVQSTQRVITVSASPTNDIVYLTRFNSDGNIDSTFKLFGIACNFLDYATVRILNLADDRFMLFGKSPSDDSIALLRFYPDGIIDSSFGINGIRKYWLDSLTFDTPVPECLSVQYDGKIVLATRRAGSRPHILRIHADGRIDSLFGDNGFTLLSPIAALGYKVTDILFQNNRILLAGGNVWANDTKFGVRALKYDGTIDSSFGINGIALVDMGFDAQVVSGRLQSDEKIVLGGTSGSGYSKDIALTRLTKDGQTDSLFAENGIALTSLKNASWDYMGGINIDSRDVIWVTAEKYDPNGFVIFEPALIRYTKDGIVDSTYYGDGRLFFTLTSHYITYTRTEISENKLLIFGDGWWSGNNNIYVSRLFLRPGLMTSNGDTSCAGDTILLTCNNNLLPQWYRNGTLLPDSGKVLKAYQSGLYRVVLADGLAIDSSISIALTFLQPHDTPVITKYGIYLESTPAVTYAWYHSNPDTAIPNATNQKFYPAVSGNYFVRVTDSNGCASTSIPVNFTNLSVIGTFTKKMLVNIFPNPVYSKATIQFSEDISGGIRLVFVNTLGQVIKTVLLDKVENNTISFDKKGLSPGMYYLKLYCENGPNSSTKIIIR